MTTLTAAQYTIEHDPEADLYLVLDRDGQHAADGETMAEAEQEIERLMADDMRAEIEKKLWDVTDLGTLERIRAMLGE